MPRKSSSEKCHDEKKQSGCANEQGSEPDQSVARQGGDRSQRDRDLKYGYGIRIPVMTVKQVVGFAGLLISFILQLSCLVLDFDLLPRVALFLLFVLRWGIFADGEP